MKRIYLVHCWDGTSEDGWYPWLAEQLTSDDVKVIRFDMPNTAAPSIEEWVKTLGSKVGQLDERAYFVGHSIGCQTIMRYLERQEVTKIGGILFVAPWLDLLPEAVADEESYKVAQPWLRTPIDFEKVRRFTNNIKCIFSDNDYFVAVEQEQEFRDKLGAETMIVRGQGHISQDDSVYELQEILELSKKMIGDSK